MKSTTKERLKQCHKAIGLRGTFETTDTIEWTRKWCENYADNQLKLQQLKKYELSRVIKDLETKEDYYLEIVFDQSTKFLVLICFCIILVAIFYKP